jgi:hypothetical protein
MKNIVTLQKDEEGNIYCQEISEEGLKLIKRINDGEIKDTGYWDKGGTILLDELEEILDKEI